MNEKMKLRRRLYELDFAIYIETVTLSSDCVVICNEEGMLRGLPYNCNICGIDFVGTIVFAGINGDEFSDIPLSFKNFKELFGF